MRVFAFDAEFCKLYLSQVPGFTPSPSFERLAPGPHLFELNEALRQFYKEKERVGQEGGGQGLIVVSLLEGLMTEFM